MLTARRQRIDRPFDPKVLKAAARQAGQYQITLSFEDGYWFGRILEWPEVMNHGKTPNAAVKAARDMLTTVIAYHLEEGLPIPQAGSEQRSQQINIRVSPLEKLRIENAARSKGFRGVGDFVRTAALGRGLKSLRRRENARKFAAGARLAPRTGS